MLLTEGAIPLMLQPLKPFLVEEFFDQGFCPLAGSVPDYGEAYIATLVLILLWNLVP